MVIERFGSRYALVAAAITMAVGAGNIWRFPRVVAQWGSGTFLLVVVVATLVWAIPLLIAESLMGSRSRLGTVGAFRDVMGRRFAWAGAFMAMCTVGILCYYSVISGWALRYFARSLTGEFAAPNVDAAAVWEGFIASPVQTVSFHLVALLLVGALVLRGLKGGFEGVLKAALPALFVILAILAIRAVTLPGAGEGLRHLFVPDLASLGDARVWLEAFTQVAFSTGAGWGLYLTYSVYSRRREDMGGNAVIVVSGNFLVSLLAGTVVLCSLFALGSSAYAQEAVAAGNEGLAFIYFTQLFGQMPGGAVFAPLFFLALALAALSTMVALLELAVRNVMDMGAGRRGATVGVMVVAFLAGLPSAFRLGFLQNQDFVWGVALLVSGMLVAVAMLRYGVGRARAEITATSSIPLGAWWAWCIRAVPVLFVVLFGWWVYQSVAEFAPDSWWDPFDRFSLATMVVQLVVLFVVVYALNGFLARRVRSGPMSGESVTDEQAPGS